MSCVTALIWLQLFSHFHQGRLQGLTTEAETVWGKRRTNFISIPVLFKSLTVQKHIKHSLDEQHLSWLICKLQIKRGLNTAHLYYL